MWTARRGGGAGALEMNLIVCLYKMFDSIHIFVFIYDECVWRDVIEKDESKHRQSTIRFTLSKFILFHIRRIWFYIWICNTFITCLYNNNTFGAILYYFAICQVIIYMCNWNDALLREFWSFWIIMMPSL